MQDIEELPLGFDDQLNKGRTEQYKLKQKLRKEKGKQRAS